MAGTSAKESIERLKAAIGPWKDRRPKRIFAFLAADDPAAFIRQNIITAAIGKRFPGAVITAAYRADTPFKSFTVACNPYIRSDLRAGANAPFTVLLDWFDIGGAAPVSCPDPGWAERGLINPDLLLTPGMLAGDPSRLAIVCEAPPAFRLPDDGEASLLNSLAQQGISQEQWFVCVEGAAAPSLMGHINKTQGGQVVCLGGGGDARGAIDLSAAAFEVQAAAISRARYFIGEDRCLSSLASAFRVPAACIAPGPFDGRAWNPEDVIVNTASPAAEEAIRLADHMLAATGDCSAWREPGAERPVKTETALTLPFPMLERPVVTFWERA